MQSRFKPSPVMLVFITAGSTAFAISYSIYLVRALEGVPLGVPIVLLLVFKTAVEIGASTYGFGFLFTAIVYPFLKPPVSGRGEDAGLRPPVGIVYLCCNDLDRDALLSLARLRYRGKLYLVIHDDSDSPAARRAVDRMVEELRRGHAPEVLLLRRPRREGGKPGALNYVLEQTAHLYEFFFLADNDSTATDPDALHVALPFFEDPSVAVVQCRNVAIGMESYCSLNRHLSRSIDVFHAFLSMCARFGWMPFIGHNALLSVRAVQEAGGFTPGFFSDDLDLTVRLNVKGYRVAYAPQIRFGEKHPPSYRAFRLRSYKWAFGCMQTLKAHGGTVLTTPAMSVAEKWSFFHFAGFYAGQTLLLLYLVATFLIAPLYLRDYPVDVPLSLLAGTLIVVLIYLPIVSYFLKERSTGWLRSLVAFGLVYGATDFSAARGVWDYLRQRKSHWTPTNMPSRDGDERRYAAEASFGAALLVVPLFSFPAVLYLPCSYLFALKFLVAPAVALLYDDRRRLPAAGRARVPSAAALLLVTVIGAGWLMAPAPRPSDETGVTIRGTQIYVDGQPFFVRGVHYGPWRPGTGPNKHYAYPGPELVDADLALIQDLNANTILVFEPPEHVLDLAHRRGLKVLYTFALNWWELGPSVPEEVRASILARVEKFRRKPALLAWILGNEIPSRALHQRGEEPIRAGLAELYRAVKTVDGEHPITHSNWPITRDLELEFMDVASFNLYPLWPPEVVAMGFRSYIERELRPRAGNRPLLITEFGVNTLEAGEEGQKELLSASWKAIRAAQTSGGVVFEFADEWWKNYDNPVREGVWWDREPAPDDERAHDLDPEEYYGLVDTERVPRPAFHAMKALFEADERGDDSRTWLIVPTTLVILGCLGLWIWARRPWLREREN